MNQGSCLCGSIRWSICGQALESSHCHCSMCRKAHGAAFGTYYQFKAEDFNWLSDLETLKKFKPGPEAGRVFCCKCGSVVPDFTEDGKAVSVPAGSHRDGPVVDAHIFVASKAPWYDVTDDLPKYDEFSPGEQLTVYPDKLLPEKPEGVIRGSCLCNLIQFAIIEPIEVVHNCHCSCCRRARAAAFATNGFTSFGGVKFISGESNIRFYKVPDAKFFTQAFCKTCGSPVPRKDSSRDIVVIPFGSLDDAPGVEPDDHIFVENKASWYEISDDLPQFKQMPK